MNNKYIKTIRNYVAEVEGDYINMYKPNFINKLDKDIVPSLLKLNEKLKQFQFIDELKFNSIVINCLNSIDKDTDTENVINNLYKSIAKAEGGVTC